MDSDSNHDQPALPGVGAPEATLRESLPRVDADDRPLLEAARSALEAAGFYAYIMFDDQQRWCVAADDELGRIDILAEQDHFAMSVCGSSPGLFMEEESEWRRRALERLARRVVPNIAQGMLESHQRASWDQQEHGVSVCTTHAVPLDDPGRLPVVARQALTDLDDLLTLVESQLRN
jgi:hypothetical protein